MIYPVYSIGGELFHGERANHKYVDKVRTRSGKWRYVYQKANNKVGATNKKSGLSKLNTMKKASLTILDDIELRKRSDDELDDAEYVYRDNINNPDRHEHGIPKEYAELHMKNVQREKERRKGNTKNGR